MLGKFLSTCLVVLACVLTPFGVGALGPVGLVPEGPQPNTELAQAWTTGKPPAALATRHTPKRIVFHWTAGSHTSTFAYYHFNVLGNGKNVATYPVLTVGAHVWKRNTGAVGISACAGGGASIVRGLLVNTKWPLLPIQIETMAKTGAELCLDYRIDPAGFDMVDGHKVPTLTGHHFWAVLDGYGPDRSEMGAYEAGLFTKVKWYFAKLGAGVQQFQHTRKGGLK